MKKSHLLPIIPGMFLVLALIIPPNKQNLAFSLETKVIQSIAAKLPLDDFQEDKFSMKPAWYRFFNVHTADKLPKLGAGLEFKFQEEQNLKGFINCKLINTSEADISIRIQNGSLIMIQEAKNEKGQWQPIEYWDYDWGDGSVFDQLVLGPQKAILISAPQYKGDFETQIRFKLKIGDSIGTEDIYYSPAFAGSISLSQFKINPQFKDNTISYLEK